MELKEVLQGVDLFEGQQDYELEEVAEICTQRIYHMGDIITREGEAGNELYIITDGFVEIILGDRPASSARVFVSLGSGQITGEMALLDQGPRSATVRAASDPTIVQVIDR